MVVWCNNCKRYVNQVCERCGDSFGELYCEKYACGGKMICPICRGYDLESVAEHKEKEKTQVDKYDYATQRKLGIEPGSQQPRKQGQAQPAKPAQPQTGHCMSCGFEINKSWNFCPNCGINLRLKK